MSYHDGVLLVVAAVLVVLAGVFAGAEAALSSYSKVRADEQVEQGNTRAAKLAELLADAPRYLNTLLLVRLICEITAIVLVTQALSNVFAVTWEHILITAVLMVVVSYVIIGVAPRTLGRQHSDRFAMLSAGPVMALTSVLGPIPKLLILLGNALTPGKGYAEGPFATESELRALVDYAEKSAVIESGERQMIHSVFELGDTIAREVMVPRTDMVYIERHKKLRQLTSLALRSGYSRIPVIGESLDDIVGVVYLKDVMRRVYDNAQSESTERVESVMRPCMYIPDSKPADQLLREMQAARMHVAIVVDEYGGTAGLVTIEDILEEIVGEITDEYDEAPEAVQALADGAFRVSSRYPVDELGELFGLPLDDDDVDTVGGLMAKLLGKVPIPGAEVEIPDLGLSLTAERPSGRRNQVGTVLVRRTDEVAEQPQDPSHQTA
ncbi:CBS domain containing-hemolysin-like protein [Kribbella amoyensis]|uniref:CBS domain containing-hemolysin-like protein n=1 Tax=Kribbella amoyensis TaxID=996641 RepID=A0A561BVM3_9ACTN|nr:hemolysin family protein [Kribbella amoyensis]TWD82930.1 CBS domain containing-hemolysin-like protein [Kribbella amoyensis]